MDQMIASVCARIVRIKRGYLTFELASRRGNIKDTNILNTFYITSNKSLRNVAVTTADNFVLKISIDSLYEINTRENDDYINV